MSTVLGAVDTDSQPPLSVPLRHFVVALGFLLAGAGLGVVDALGVAPGLARLAHLHLLLVGFVCLTIAGAMTQFVPVWSGTALHSRRLARGQLWLVGSGVAGFAAALLAGRLAVLPVFGVAMLAGFWTLAYNVGRTLGAARPLDVTERHFAVALAFFVAATGLGLMLAVGFATPLALPVTRPSTVAAHATLATFGAVLTTVFGALYQLVTMFGQTEFDGVDHALRRVETAGYPLGVAVLAAGRLAGSTATARVGAVLTLVGVAAFTVVLVRRLSAARAGRTPMLVRYALLAPAMALWLAATAPAWLRAPRADGAVFGAPGTAHLFGTVVLLVLVGTLYHVVPFLVWVHRYSDRLGVEDVPMIDDLYDDRFETVDLVLVAGGCALLATGDWLGADTVSLVGGVALTAGLLVFVANLALVVWRHAPESLYCGPTAEPTGD